jgi:predicted RNase H-like nuclease (RuvC/YqgF family)
MNTSANPKPPRLSKLDTLNASLVTAKAALASAQAALQPRIDAEQEKVNALRIAYEKAGKASTNAYNEYQRVLTSAEARLFPTETYKRLLEAVKAKLEAYPHANFVRLANEYKHRMVGADASVVAAKAAHDATRQVEEKARRAYWAADSYDSELSRLTAKLGSYKERVAELEKEIERLPKRNASARDRRAAEKQEELEAEQTQAARALLADFSLDAQS